MKAFKETVKQYYRTFTQPTLTSNGTMGGDSFACTGSANVSNAYIPFNGTGNLWDTYSSPAPQYITWYNPNAINITYMTIGQYSGEPYYYYITSAVVQGSNDNSTWTDITTIGNQYNVVTINVDMSSNTGYYKYHRLYVSGTNYYSGYPRVFVGAIKMTATEYIEAGFDVDTYKISVETETQYYKPFSQPVLTANGTLGGSSFAVASSSIQSGTDRQPWRAFNPSSSEPFHTAGGMPQWFTMYNPTPLKITQINWVTTIATGTVQGSNDNSSWTDLLTITSHTDVFDLSSNTQAFNYYRIYFASSTYAWEGVYYINTEKIQLVAQEYISEGFDITSYKAIKYY